jgi:hypothetical protein
MLIQKFAEDIETNQTMFVSAQNTFKQNQISEYHSAEKSSSEYSHSTQENFDSQNRSQKPSSRSSTIS